MNGFIPLFLPVNLPPGPLCISKDKVFEPDFQFFPSPLEFKGFDCFRFQMNIGDPHLYGLQIMELARTIQA